MSAEKYQNKYRIASARMKNYDYASNGAYFITIVTQNRDHFFGDIVDNKMILNEIGKIAQKYWDEIPQHFPFIRLDEMVVMPNHIHGILWIDDDLVGGGCRDAINRVSTATTEKFEKTKKSGGITGKNNPMFYDNISRVLRWYKGRYTFEINKMAETRLIASLPNFACNPDSTTVSSVMKTN
jgi:REP element-mobilizing transposase RayT